MSQRIRFSLLSITFLFALRSTAQAQPNPPTNVAPTPSNGSAQVSWDAVPGAVSYKIYWSKTTPVTKQNAESPSPINAAGTQAAAAPLANGTKYYIAVTAVNPSGESDLSNEVGVTPVAQADAHNANQPSTTVSAPVQPSTNVGQSSDTNVQNPTMTFVPFNPSSEPVVAQTNNLPNGTITFDSAGVEKLVKDSCAGSTAAMESSSTYVVINVIHLTGGADAQRVDSNNWYIYSPHKSFVTGFAGGWKLADFDGATRLYGARKILLVSIVEHDLTAYGPGLGPVVDYSLTITKQQATNVSDAVQLLGLVFPNKAAAGNPGDHPNYWACSTVPVAYKTSTIKVSLSYTAANNSPYTASQTFVNEAKEHWDVSFALPVKKASALQYNSTANTVTASQINKSALYAVFDFYPYPVDLKNSKFNFIPGIFAGVAMNSQPLHSLIFGASVGTKFAQFYAGALLLKQQNLSGLSTGGTGSPAQVASETSYVYQPQFSVGIKISISATASALKGSK